MNYIQWSRFYSIPAILNQCMINIGGNTYDAKISLDESRNMIHVSYKDEYKREHVLKIFLFYIDAIGEGSLLMVNNSEPNGERCVLVIPGGGVSDCEEDEDEEETEDA